MEIWQGLFLIQNGIKQKKSPRGRFFVYFEYRYYLAKSSNIFALNSGPLKSCATTFPDASRIKVAGIDSTPYCFAIGSSQNFKLET